MDPVFYFRACMPCMEPHWHTLLKLQVVNMSNFILVQGVSLPSIS